MKCRLLNSGDAAVLVEVAGIDEVLGLHAALTADDLAEVIDLVPAARTVLVQVTPGTPMEPLRTRLRQVAKDTGAVPADASDDADGDVLVIPTVYDGPDLDAVAELTGLDAQEVVAAHTGQSWRVAFAGFAPGFGYLVGGDVRLQVRRRDDPRTEVPAGAVGLAGEFSGVYPRVSPGGWQLIGRTELVMWDETRDEPALLRPGRAVRFEQVDA
ncbi:MAG: allophanate hydrolase subunit 1 [Actinomycetota bacterium]|nr:allophanate hydrolase subunit 1 [Actinomycetota bacterium]MDQ3432433.1 allophanate hydrolase subunit 1 [Actinomycetota bacterium]